MKQRTVFNIDNNKKKRVFSEGSRDIEDWSNDADYSALITGRNYSLKCIEIENSCFKL